MVHEKQASAQNISFKAHVLHSSHLGSIPLHLCLLRSLQDSVGDKTTLWITITIIQSTKHAVPRIALFCRPRAGLWLHVVQHLLHVLGRDATVSAGR